MHLQSMHMHVKARVIAAAGLLITLTGLRTRRGQEGVVVATSLPEQQPQRVAVGD